MSIEKVTLKKSISLFTACAIIIGTIIGSGIFISPNSVLEDAGSPGIALIVWVVAGLISLTGAICYTELGTIIQTSGGDYIYINESYGDLMSFLYMWTMIFLCLPCLNSIAAITIAEYLVKLFAKDCVDSQFSIKIIAALTLCKKIDKN
jgi:amino acid transporter